MLASKSKRPVESSIEIAPRTQIDLTWNHIDDFSADDLDKLAKIITAEELDHVRAARSLTLQKTRLLARALLRKELSARTMVAPELLALQLTPYGKPFLACAEGPHFNLAYSRGWILHAFCQSWEIGADVEAIDESLITAALMQDVMTKTEQAYLADLPPLQKAGAFFQLWTVKESVLKASGKGLGGLSDLRTATAATYTLAGQSFQTAAIVAPVSDALAAAIAWPKLAEKEG